MSTLFISHSAPDHAIAEALEKAINVLSEGCSEPITITYSSSASKGPEGGEEWRGWIEKQIVAATTVLVILSRESITRHWPIWEAAACRGVALQRKQENKDPVTPKIIALSYGITNEECPDPFREEQIFSGESKEGMKEVFTQVLEFHKIDSSTMLDAGIKMGKAFDSYIKKIQQSLLSTPSLVTEASVQDWLVRLDELIKDNRLPELIKYQDWMNIAFGLNSEATMQNQIDLRLHRRLGEYYLDQREFNHAKQQLRLARKSAPRDIYVLSRLTESLIKHMLKDKNKLSADRFEAEVEELIDRIKTLDPDALYDNPDTAALAAKYQRLIKNDPKEAIETYKKALKNNPDSYYLADVLGQTQIEINAVESAKKTYRNALEILDRIPDHSIWSLATKVTANLVLGHTLIAKETIQEIIKLEPTQNELASIKSGIQDICKKLSINEQELIIKELGA